VAEIFLDSSVVFKRYVPAETHSRRVQRACAPSSRNLIVLARHTSVEVASALGRRTREGALPPGDQVRLWRTFQQHWLDQYRVVAASDEVFETAERLVFGHPLRAADAIQVASALFVVRHSPAGRLRFWTADRRQAAAAQAEGLDVELLARISHAGAPGYTLLDGDTWLEAQRPYRAVPPGDCSARASRWAWQREPPG